MENIFGYRANRFLRKSTTIKEETPKKKKFKKFVAIARCAYCGCVDSYVKGICIRCGGNQQIMEEDE